MSQLHKINKETFLKTKEHHRLFFQSWEVPQAEYGILITHGQAEHSGCYETLIDSFQNEKCNFYGFDFRGHGKSDGIRGYAQSAFDYLEDFQTFVKFVLQLENRPSKLFLFSHSMGGMIQVLAQTNDYFKKNLLPAFRGQILSAPLMGVAIDVPFWKKEGAKLIRSLIPQLTLGNEIKNEMLSQDPQILKKYDQDNLRHGKISAGVYLSFFDIFKILDQQAHEITLPTLLLLGKSDRVVSISEAERIFNLFQSADKTLQFFEKSRHELINDIEREIVFQKIKERIQEWLS